MRLSFRSFSLLITLVHSTFHDYNLQFFYYYFVLLQSVTLFSSERGYLWTLFIVSMVDCLFSFCLHLFAPWHGLSCLSSIAIAKNWKAQTKQQQQKILNFYCFKILLQLQMDALSLTSLASDPDLALFSCLCHLSQPPDWVNHFNCLIVNRLLFDALNINIFVFVCVYALSNWSSGL